MKWNFELIGGETLFHACGGRNEKATAFDPWEKRADFFRLTEGDNDGLTVFLNSVGLFSPAWPGDQPHDSSDYRYIDAATGSHMVWGSSLPLSAANIWGTRKMTIREMKSPTARRGFDAWDFSTRLAHLRDGNAAVITTLNFSDALAAASRIDHLLQAKVRKCARPDCPVVFATVSQRKIFCEWDCGHLEQVRRSRRKAR